MDIWLLDRNRQSIGLIDDYISLLWTERYNEAGDFEMVVPITSRYVKYFLPDNYLWNKESGAVMVIDYIQIETDYEAGNRIQLKGFSFEYVLNRRVVHGYTFDEAQVSKVLKSIFLLNFIEPENEARKIDFIQYREPSSTDGNLLYSGNIASAATCYELMTDMCMQTGLGFRARMSENGTFTFSVYNGIDHSWDQDKNPWRVYSPKYNNLLQTEFYQNMENYANSAVICGEEASQTINPTNGDIYNWPQVWTYIDGDETGIERREVFVDESSVERWQGVYMLGKYLAFEMKPSQDQTRGWKKLDEATYAKMLQIKAKEELNKLAIDTKFEATADWQTQWKLNQDVFLGDIVQVENEYGMTMRCRISEVIIAHDINGYQVYPTFIDADLPYEPAFDEG